MEFQQPHIPGLTSAVIIPADAPWLPESLRHRADDIEIRFRFSEGERRIYRRKRKGVKPSEFAAAKLKFTSGPSVGQPMDFTDTPYTAAILDASFFPSVQEITVVSGPQMLKTTLVQAALGYIAEFDPGPVMVNYPDQATTKENSKDRIQKLFTASPAMAHHLTGYVDDLSAMRIDLVGMSIYMTHAGSATSTANRSARYLFNDEKAKFPDTPNKDEAGSSDLADKRTNSFRFNKKIWNLSTTKREGDLIWQDLTVRAEVIFKFYVCCPACLKHQVMEFGDKESPSGFKWPADERDPEKIKNHDLAWYQCECGAKWDSFDREKAVRHGEFRAEGDGRELFAYLQAYRPVHIGFHLPAWLSKFISLGKVVGTFLAGSKDKLKLRDYQNNYAAEPWFDYHQENRVDKILALREPSRKAGIVPGGGLVAALVFGVDTQDDGYHYVIRAIGWGQTQTTWKVRCGFVTTEEALEQVLWQDQYFDADGHAHQVRFGIQDSAGHRTKEVYHFCLKHRGRILPSKGRQEMRQPFSYSNIEFFPGTKTPLPGGLQLVNVHTTIFKDELDRRLDISAADPGAFLLDGDTDEDYARQLDAEYRDEKGIWQQKGNRPNHKWDCEVLCLVAAEHLGLKYQKKKAPVEASARPESPSREEKSGRPSWLDRRR